MSGPELQNNNESINNSTPQGEKNLIWGFLLPFIASCLAIINNVVVTGYLIPHHIQSAPWLILIIPLTIIFPFAGLILFGLGCSRYSNEKGYGTALGWILGLLLSLVGLIILAFLPNKNQDGQPEKILTRRVKTLYGILIIIFILLVVILIVYRKNNPVSIETANPLFINSTLPPTQDKSAWTKFPGESYGVTFSYPSNLFDIYDSFHACNEPITCPNFTQFATIGNTRYWNAGLFAAKGEAGSMNVSLLLDYNDISQIPMSKIFGSGTLIPATVGNKSGYKLINTKSNCSQIYYIASGGTIRDPSEFGEGHNGNTLIVINFDGCTTGMAVNNNQSYIDSILNTFSVK